MVMLKFSYLLLEARHKECVINNCFKIHVKSNVGGVSVENLVFCVFHCFHYRMANGNAANILCETKYLALNLSC